MLHEARPRTRYQGERPRSAGKQQLREMLPTQVPETPASKESLINTLLAQVTQLNPNWFPSPQFLALTPKQKEVFLRTEISRLKQREKEKTAQVQRQMEEMWMTHEFEEAIKHFAAEEKLAQTLTTRYNVAIGEPDQYVLAANSCLRVTVNNTDGWTLESVHTADKFVTTKLQKNPDGEWEILAQLNRQIPASVLIVQRKGNETRIRQIDLYPQKTAILINPINQSL
jgi:hypothetical protein